MDRNKLAVLTNQLGGYDEIERVLGIDAELAKRAIEGQPLSNRENADIETAYNQLIYHPVLADANLIDLDQVNEDAFELSKLQVLLEKYGPIFIDKFTVGYAENPIDPDLVRDLDIVFHDATSAQVEKIFEVLEAGDVDEFNAMLQAVHDDYAGGIGWHDITDGAFWEWYREYFYGDD